MNRLVLVGNGFDLAHGLKTSYCNFISWYLEEALKTFHAKQYYNDDLLLISHRHKHMQYFPPLPPKSKEKVIEAFNYLQSESCWNVEIKSELIEKTIDKTFELNWVDIEVEYFDELFNCQEDGVFDSEAVEKLNKQFGFLKEKLEEYLLTQQLIFDNLEPEAQILEELQSNFKFEDFDIGFEKNQGEEFKRVLDKPDSYKKPSYTLILNFNYTNTAYKYVAYLKEVLHQQNVEINYIHGKLENISNPIIFGFGDEFNKTYKLFEEQKNNSVFEYIKSFWYLKSSNYRNLVKFLNKDMFQVFIMGHSCGL